MNNSPVKSELYVAYENGRINSILTIYEILYRDTGHLSYLGSLYVGKHLKKMVDNRL